MGLPLLAGDGRPASATPVYEWNGTSLGSPSRLLLVHPDPETADRIVAQCIDEIERLERIFALFRPESELARLNRGGRIDSPSQDLLVVLSASLRLAELSGGAFDVSVQPLWNLYARHFFAGTSPAPDGPPRQALESALKLVDWRAIELSPRRVALARPGMGLTLNGIAQGYVTDRVTSILREGGCERILANLGGSEIGAFELNASDAPWRIGLADPKRPDRVATALNLSNGALCTSGGYGTKFEASGRFHHLFDPLTGASANQYIASSVLAPSAMVADALSTALYVTPATRTASLIGHFDHVTALMTHPDGTITRFQGGGRQTQSYL